MQKLNEENPLPQLIRKAAKKECTSEDIKLLAQFRNSFPNDEKKPSTHPLSIALLRFQSDVTLFTQVFALEFIWRDEYDIGPPVMAISEFIFALPKDEQKRILTLFLHSFSEGYFSACEDHSENMLALTELVFVLSRTAPVHNINSELFLKAMSRLFIIRSETFAFALDMDEINPGIDTKSFVRLLDYVKANRVLNNNSLFPFSFPSRIMDEISLAIIIRVLLTSNLTTHEVYIKTISDLLNNFSKLKFSDVFQYLQPNMSALFADYLFFISIDQSLAERERIALIANATKQIEPYFAENTEEYTLLKYFHGSVTDISAVTNTQLTKAKAPRKKKSIPEKDNSHPFLIISQLRDLSKSLSTIKAYFELVPDISQLLSDLEKHREMGILPILDVISMLHHSHELLRYDFRNTMIVSVCHNYIQLFEKIVTRYEQFVIEKNNEIVYDPKDPSSICKSFRKTASEFNKILEVLCLSRDVLWMSSFVANSFRTFMSRIEVKLEEIITTLFQRQRSVFISLDLKKQKEYKDVLEAKEIETKTLLDSQEKSLTELRQITTESKQKFIADKMASEESQEKMQNQINELTSSYETLDNELSAINAQLHNSDTQNQHAHVEIKSLEAMNRQLRATVQSLKEQLRETRLQWEAERSTFERSQGRYVSELATLNATNSQLALWLTYFQSFYQTTSSVLQENQILKTVYADLMTHNRELNLEFSRTVQKYLEERKSTPVPSMTSSISIPAAPIQSETSTESSPEPRLLPERRKTW